MHNKDIKNGRINESDLIPADEFQEKMEVRSEFISVNNSNKVMVFDSSNKIIKVSTSNSMYVSGELKSIYTEYIRCRDKNNRYTTVRKDDSRLKSRELVPATKDMVRITKKGINKTVIEELLSEYIDKGWERGVCYTTNFVGVNKNTKWVNKNNKNKRIPSEEISWYINNGWNKGHYVKNRQVVKGSKNNNWSPVYIYDKHDNLRYVSDKSLQEFLNEHKLPHTISGYLSTNENKKRLYVSSKPNKEYVHYIEYKGWWATRQPLQETFFA